MLAGNIGGTILADNRRPFRNDWTVDVKVGNHPGSCPHGRALDTPKGTSAVDELTQKLFACRDRARRDMHAANEHLIGLLRQNSPDLTTAMGRVLEQQAFADWWTSVTDQINNGAKPAIALNNIRAAAIETALIPLMQRRTCWHAEIKVIATIEAAARFCDASARLLPNERAETPPAAGTETS